MIPQEKPPVTTLFEGVEVLSPEERITKDIRELRLLLDSGRYPGRQMEIDNVSLHLAWLWGRYLQGRLPWTVDGREVTT